MLDLIRLNFERIQLQIQDFRWQMSQHLMSLTPQQIRYLLKLHQGGMQLLMSLMSSHLWLSQHHSMLIVNLLQLRLDLQSSV
jgi:hypothetical protein